MPFSTALCETQRLVLSVSHADIVAIQKYRQHRTLRPQDPKTPRIIKYQRWKGSSTSEGHNQRQTTGQVIKKGVSYRHLSFLHSWKIC